MFAACSHNAKQVAMRRFTYSNNSLDSLRGRPPQTHLTPVEYFLSACCFEFFTGETLVDPCPAGA